MSKPREFWILDDNPNQPYPTCYRGEPTWGCEPDTTGAVVHVREVTPLSDAAQYLVDTVKFLIQTVHQAHHSGDLEMCGMNTCMAGKEAIRKAEGRE